jgi:membrane-associated protease RseP (regulator of RpoE activity)
MEIINGIINGEIKKELYLGVDAVEVGKEYSQIYGLPEGVYVKNVVKDSPAEKAGMYSGDIIVEIEGKEVYTTEDVAPYIGVGYILTKVVNNSRKYKVDFFNKVKFAEISYDQNTKGESIEYSTPTIEGTISVLKDGSWRKSQTFTDLDDAITYLKGLMAAPKP